jgi:hypothetical protein
MKPCVGVVVNFYRDWICWCDSHFIYEYKINH